MKSRVIELQEKANQLLELAQAMDKRVERAESIAETNKEMYPNSYIRWMRKSDTCRRGSNRLWSAYIQILTEIKLEL